MAFYVKKADNSVIRKDIDMPKVIGTKPNGKNKYSSTETEKTPFYLPANFVELLEKQDTVETVFKPNTFEHEGKTYELVWK